MYNTSISFQRLAALAIVTTSTFGCSSQVEGNDPAVELRDPGRVDAVHHGPRQCGDGVARSGEICFDEVFTLAAGQRPTRVVSADFDGDGHLDVAAIDGDGGELLVWHGDGSGALSEPERRSVQAPSALVAADFDGDGAADLAVAQNGHSHRVLIFSGADLDQVDSVDAGAGPRSLAAGDLNGDGELDLAAAAYDDNGARYATRGQAGFEGPFVLDDGLTFSPMSIVVSDVNGDGHHDVLVATEYWHFVAVFLGDGAGSFATPSFDDTIFVGDQPRDMAVADFDEDGHPDFATVGWLMSDVSVAIGDGSGGFEIPGYNPVGERPAALAVADVDGDGHADIATANEESHDVSLMLGVGDGSFDEALSFAAGQQPSGIALADLNEDGVVDIITSGAASGDLTLRLSTP